MSMPCDLPVLKPNEIVLVIDVFSKSVKKEFFNQMPEDVRYIEGDVECEGKIKNFLIPVAEIRVSTFDESGRLVPKDKATNMLIEYFDKNGKVLNVTRMKGRKA